MVSPGHAPKPTLHTNAQEAPVPDPTVDLSAPLSSVSEEELLALVFPVYRPEPGSASERNLRDWVPLGNGDDTAWVRTSDSATLATTDTMVRGADWLDEWSTPLQVGAKCAAQNLADIAAMGGVTRALLVTLVAEPTTTVGWAVEFAKGVAHAAAEAGTSVVGGDLSSAMPGTLTVSITALGDMRGRAPVRRSGARPGDVIAVAGTLGRSGAGFALLRAGAARQGRVAELIETHVRPQPPIEQGPVAAVAGATSMIDLSDGLMIDAGRVARASGVCMALRTDALAPDVEYLAAALPRDEAVQCVLGGGEEHSLLATFPDEQSVPKGWRVLGEVQELTPGASEKGTVTLDGAHEEVRTWDHFAR